ncbi:hypothetical protein [Ruixingdingia sedimenti]|uniref:Uncharacterized protein n=1 Tax=Ruixingdingia sedimenti TaxID=3073604 RepID=A0ABU1F505_9RHOB|nr:hypothetical protein [Xinfangfangia sp. LG-4]MDR5651956.1 hypothetical protein [Xinfangfangia sp. LG-4]
MRVKSPRLAAMAGLIGLLILARLAEMAGLAAVPPQVYAALILAIAVLNLWLLIANYRRGMVDVFAVGRPIERKKNAVAFFFVFFALMALTIGLIAVLVRFLAG